jgi:hypothetical protein
LGYLQRIRIQWSISATVAISLRSLVVVFFQFFLNLKSKIIF